MTERAITRIMLADGRIRTTFKRADETSALYAARVLALAQSEDPGGHLCTTLTGCLPGGTTELQHCTPFNGATASPAVIAAHAADVAALCEVLECADCGG